MKTESFLPAGSTGRRGVALVFVLGAIVLVTILALAFLAMVTIERQTSSAYAHSLEARMVADSAVNLVMGQIRQASEQDGKIWTSQPGLLRTFDGDGTPDRVFKLYSALPQSAAAASFDPADDVPGSWTNRPADYVDLNRPVVARSGAGMTTNYPILDPRGAILDSQGAPKIEGFFVDANGVQMPVAWVYVLEDGSLTNSTGLSANNPPVARMAFWTDDETCKLNINTASEGFFWDMPRAQGSAKEWDMAVRQPVQGEYQGYPGHPATTSLSPVLWKYFQEKNPSLLRDASATSTNTFPEVLYHLLPRTSEGGSQGGTKAIPDLTGSLGPKTNRLFSSVDEMAFLASSTDGVRDTSTSLDREVIEQTRFFLTGHSRAPELTLGGLPRVTAWPISAVNDDQHRTPFDKLIAFASTINGHPYYFTRNNPKSPTADFTGRNVELYQYLQRLTKENVPGIGGNFFNKYGTDRDQILTEIFDYIRCVNLTDSSSPDPSFVPFTPLGSVSTSNGTYKIGWVIPALGAGQVVPIAPPGGGPGAGTKGFGRFQTLNRAILVLSAAEEDKPNKVSQLQAAVLFETFDPSLGPAPLGPDYELRVTTPTPFTVVSGTATGDKTGSVSFSGLLPANAQPGAHKASDRGGYNGFIALTTIYREGELSWKGRGDLDEPNPYQYVTPPFPVSWNAEDGSGDNDSTIDVSAGKIQVEVLGPLGDVVQTLDFEFPGFSTKMPQPKWPVYTGPESWKNELYADVAGYKYSHFDQRVPMSKQAISPPLEYARRNFVGYWISEADVARSVEATGSGIDGDLRLVAARKDVSGLFAPIPGYNSFNQREYAALTGLNTQRLMSLRIYEETSGYNNQRFGALVQGSIVDGNGANTPEDDISRFRGASFVPPGINGAVNADGRRGDWDTGMGPFPNGPYINRSDDGDIGLRINSDGEVDVNLKPYNVHIKSRVLPGQTFSSPSRQMPSAVMFGSLPTGVLANPPQPWQTLLFCPNPASRYGPNAGAHPGEAAPKDHLLLDLFQIPVVEPYAISEPFSTAGKVNMNSQIIPFTGIKRQTALHGVFRPVKITAINDTIWAKFKWQVVNPQLYRYDIDISETLSESFETKFASDDHVFKSASEICDVPLIPLPKADNPVAFTSLNQFWTENKMTGDNLRENPYTRLYPRLTTRSNTYTVHVWVETLKKIPSTDEGKWEERLDRVTGQYRGSFLIERYLNPSDNIPDYATNPSAAGINSFYRFRVVRSLQFNP